MHRRKTDRQTEGWTERQTKAVIFNM